MFDEFLPDDFDSDADLGPDVPFVPTDEKIVAAMLELGQVNAADRLYDLGCGDGRIVNAAAERYGAHGVGVDVDPLLLEEAREYAQWAGLADKVRFVEENLFDTDFSAASIVTLYLLHSVNLDLRPRLLAQLQPGTRIVSHTFNMGAWRADRTICVGGIHLYKWVVPAPVEGGWAWTDDDGVSCRVVLERQFQAVSGKAWLDGNPARLSARLRGDLLELVLGVANAPARKVAFRHADGVLQSTGPDGSITARRVSANS